MSDEVSFAEVPTGYGAADQFWATRFRQGERIVYGIELSLLELAAYIREPNPDHPQEGNRRITPNHAASFARYVRENDGWVSPALLLRAPDGVLEFEVKAKTPIGAEFGLLSIPRNARDELRILDGQHRILGVHMALRAMASDMDKVRGLVASARRSSDSAVVRQHELSLKRLREERDRLSNERIAVQVVIEDSPEAYKQVFADIADNAKGMSGSVRARFDSRKVVNRALPRVLEHPLLKGYVDYEVDRITNRNARFLLSAKHVADIVRSVEVGVVGRLSRRQELELDEGQVADHAIAFLNVLMESFEDLRNVAAGDLSPEDLRPRSLLGSAPILRSLAGAYFALVRDPQVDDPLSPVAIISFFGKLSKFMEAPVPDGSPWLEAEDLIDVGAMAPRTANAGALKELTSMIVGWGKSEPAWLKASAA
ncbi:MAG: DNA sulfur modification protein DndB [Actinomycetota bacterium]